ncbi:hypothetical protein OKW45_006047 [Paraburkholderia sp. WSM4175]|uniref:hypothetical protein n=1 Tax=Paraburkholderia sp. WSM4175 TaxID=2991072 RepID=UPI003D262891
MQTTLKALPIAFLISAIYGCGGSTQNTSTRHHEQHPGHDDDALDFRQQLHGWQPAGLAHSL